MPGETDSKSTMPATFSFTPTGAALLQAVGTPQSLSGAARVLPNIVSCVQAAENVWPNDQLKQWVEVAHDMQRCFSAAKSATNGVPQHFFNHFEQASKTFEQFEKWRSPGLSAGPVFEAHALLGRAVVRAASANAVIPVELMNGLQTLKRSRESDGKGGRSVGWSLLESLNLTQKEQLQDALATLTRKSPPAVFISSCLSVLDTVHQAPDSTGRESLAAAEIQSDDQLSASDVITTQASDEEPTASPQIHQFGGNDGNQDGIPDIGARLAAADWSSFGEKLGIYSRNQMLTGDLAVITQKLPRIVKQGNKRDQGFALLATVSLVTGCTDSTALQLRLQPMHSIWLDLERGLELGISISTDSPRAT